MMSSDPAEMQAAAEAAVALIEPGAVVGLGTGTTLSHLLPLLAARHQPHVCVATSPATARAATELGLEVVAFSSIERLDIAVDGADQIAPDGWLVKGGGGAHAREKVVAAAADRFVVIASSNKEVVRLAPPVPIELLAFGLEATLRLVAPARLRPSPRTPDGGVLADYLGEFDDPRRLEAQLSGTPGVVAHGLFGPELVDDIIVARGATINHRIIAASA